MDVLNTAVDSLMTSSARDDWIAVMLNVADATVTVIKEKAIQKRAKTHSTFLHHTVITIIYDKKDVYLLDLLFVTVVSFPFSGGRGSPSGVPCAFPVVHGRRERRTLVRLHHGHG